MIYLMKQSLSVDVIVNTQDDQSYTTEFESYWLLPIIRPCAISK